MSIAQAIFVIVMIVAVVVLVSPFILSGRISKEERKARGED